MIVSHDLELFERSLRHATETQTGAALDAALDELGWQDALSVDARAAVSLLFELQGSANTTSSALDRLLASRLGHEAAAVVLPQPGRWDSPGTLDGGLLAVRGVATPRLDRCRTALVVACTGDSHIAVEVDTGSLARRTIHGIDPALSLVEVTGDVGGARQVGPVDWQNAVALGHLALGHELVGASQRMLALACEHALDRVQFGRPIATFQAVRYRLAETLVAVESAGAALDAAWLDREPQTAAMAKATAGRGGRVAVRHCQQVLAGIGFTTEHPFHRYAKRVLVLEQLLGSTRSLTYALGTETLERQELPVPIPL